MTFASTQRSVAASMARALVVSLVAIGAALLAGAPSSPVDRVRLAAWAVLGVVTCLTPGIADVARRRFFSPDDIADSSAGEATMAVAQARVILQNTAEQTLLALPVQVARA